MYNSSQGILIGGGRRNLVYNNHFYSMSHLAVYFDNRGMTWQLAYCNTSGQFKKELDSMNYTLPPWSVEYPETVNDFSEQPCVPVFNVVRNNSFCNAIFTNAANSSIIAWNSTFEGNYESCKKIPRIFLIWQAYQLHISLALELPLLDP